MISESVATYPVEYLSTGDHALLVAWASLNGEVLAVLCLEDGRAVAATLDEFTFDYRYDITKGAFVDVSGVPEGIGEEDVEPDQASADHGGEAVPGLIP